MPRGDKQNPGKEVTEALQMMYLGRELERHFIS